jgi:heme exporter protein D
MEVGTAIFLSALVLGTIALYGLTMDRWPWRRFAAAVGGVLLIIVIGIVIFIVLDERRLRQESEMRQQRETRQQSAPQSVPLPPGLVLLNDLPSLADENARLKSNRR